MDMASFSKAASVSSHIEVEIGGKHEGPHSLCWQCSRPRHTDKTLKDQCRLFTALLGPRWGYKDETPAARADKKTVTFDDDGVQVHNYRDPGWFYKTWERLKRIKARVYPEVDLLTLDRPHIRTTRPRLVRRAIKC